MSGRGYTRQRSKQYREDYRAGAGGYSAGDEAAARDEGIARALGAQPASWVAAAKLATKQAALEHETLTADTVWDRLEAAGAGSAANNSAIAGVLKWAQSARLIAPTDRSALSTRDGRHRSRIAVWRSLVYSPDTPERAAWRKVFGV